MKFHIASGLDDVDDLQQVNTLLYCIGEVLSSTGTTADERKRYKTVIEIFKEFFMVRRNVIFERALFNQNEGETAENYHKLVEHCNFGEIREDLSSKSETPLFPGVFNSMPN